MDRLIHFHSYAELTEFALGANPRAARAIRQSLDGTRVRRANRQLNHAVLAGLATKFAPPAVAPVALPIAAIQGTRSGVNIARSARMKMLAKNRARRRQMQG